MPPPPTIGATTDVQTLVNASMVSVGNTKNPFCELEENPFKTGLNLQNINPSISVDKNLNDFTILVVDPEKKPSAKKEKKAKTSLSPPKWMRNTSPRKCKRPKVTKLAPCAQVSLPDVSYL